jgi:hypothetical protein
MKSLKMAIYSPLRGVDWLKFQSPKRTKYFKIMKIKFRAWDKKNKIMLYDREDICITGNGLVLFDWGNNAPNERYERTDNFIIQQSTGLFDKNGKEIFEGDILGINERVDVKYEDGSFRVYGYPITEWLSKIELRHIDSSVVGNIYEDEKLIKN